MEGTYSPGLLGVVERAADRTYEFLNSVYDAVMGRAAPGYQLGFDGGGSNFGDYRVSGFSALEEADDGMTYRNSGRGGTRNDKKRGKGKKQKKKWKSRK